MKKLVKEKKFVMTTSEETKKYLEGKGFECIGKGNVGKGSCYYFANSSPFFDEMDFSKMRLVYTDLLLF